ncbi:MAG: alkene reductase [Beijerinckiaceae bacterium]|nr:alkene reductase [Beijerinckiaceae bacterium]
MNLLFSPMRLGALELPNRIIMAPMTRSRADADGSPLDYVADFYVQRASAGLMVSEALFVSPMAKGYVRTPGIANDAQQAAWARVVAAVHKAGGRMFAQLYHTGRVALPDFLPGGALPVAPSAIAIKGQNKTDEGKKDFVVPRALESDEIPSVAAEFASAARRAMAAGFDGVEIHAASGYLIHQFLDATINRRDDRYGGSVENRARFALEVVDRVIEAVGADRTGIKVSPQIKFNDVTEPDADEVYPYLARQLSARGLAYLHGAKQGAYDVHAAMRPLFKGVYAAGAGFNSESAQAMLASGGADAIVLGKPFIANPDLPRRMREGIALAEPDFSTIYSGSQQGYVDYPAAP